MDKCTTTFTVTLTAEEYTVLQEMAEAAIDLHRKLIPKINYGTSAIPAEGFAALNEFSAAVSATEKMLRGIR